MKIGILTQPLHTNYGGLLQAYALQTTLNRLGHDSLILDRHFPQPNTLRLFLGKTKRIALKYIAGRNNVEVNPFVPTQQQRDTYGRETNKFIHKYLNKSEVLFSTGALKLEAERHHFDAFIVGSDQVWRLQYSPCITNYFLDFLEGVSDIKRITYAASFGLDHWHFTEKTTRQCKQLAQQFDAISVREDSGIDLCRQYLGVDAVHVLDPTMLLDSDDYRTLALAEGEPESTGNLMTYILDPSDEKSAIIERVASTLGLKPFTVMPKQKLTSKTQCCIEDCVFPPVSKWIRGYIDAKFVVADSFHGCVFAILFNIQFIAVGNRQRGMARFVSLLRQYDLSDRLVCSLSELTDDLIHKTINWEKVNHKRSYLKCLSIDFIRSNL